jgi:hypothetical protein
MERLQAVIDSDLSGDKRLAAIIDAYVDPALELSQSGDPGWKHYFKLVSHINFSKLWVEELEPFYNEPTRRLIAALMQLYPDATTAAQQAAALIMLGTFNFVLAEPGRIEALEEAAYSSGDLDFLAPLMKQFLLGGVRAVLSGEPWILRDPPMS